MTLEYKPSRGSIEIGNKYYRLLCLSFVEKRGHKNIFKFLCDCGKECIKIGPRVKSGYTKSCGCLRDELRKSEKVRKQLQKATNLIKKSKGEASLNVVYRTYIDRAKKYKFEFSLTIESFKYLTQQDCHYCGAKPNNIGGYKNNNGRYIYNGLDRIENNKGYTLTNCVPCCKICNVSKNNMTYIDFLQHIEAIYERQQTWIKKSYILKPRSTKK